MIFDGRKIRDQILADIKEKISQLKTKPTLAVIWVGDDKVSARYIEQKQKAAEFLGVHFDIFKFPETASVNMIIAKISELNSDQTVTGVMIQLPIPKNLDQRKLISTIASGKDVDALRFCSDIECSFRPPVTLAVLRALESAEVNLKTVSVAVIGRGFLVGEPLIRILNHQAANLRIADDKTPHLATLTADADVIISATGQPGLIKSDMIKKGAILIDAGTTEVGGELRGDIDPAAYEKSAFYTPVPGGIGPITVAVLYKNLLTAAESYKSKIQSSNVN